MHNASILQLQAQYEMVKREYNITKFVIYKKSRKMTKPQTSRPPPPSMEQQQKTVKT